MSKIWIFTVFFTFVFILLSFFYAYFAYGDNIMYYYKTYAFIFIKIITSFYRGTSDNIDYDHALDRNTDDNSNSFFQYIIIYNITLVL